MRVLAQKIIAIAKKQNIRLSIAESCTGGMLTSALIDIPGSSAVLDCSFITYSYESKSRLLNVPHEYIAKHGAVSKTVAAYMSKGALQNSLADFSVAITGIAGPTGGTKSKPVGLVFFAISRRDRDSAKIQTKTYKFIFKGTRLQIRKSACIAALTILLDYIAKAL